jgi:hypothetical protein
MSALQGMDMDKFIIIAPTLLISMYVLIKLQNRLSNCKKAWFGLIIPFICFVAATVLAFRPLFIIGDSGAEGLIGASVMVWLTFNIPTLAFMIPFVNGIKTRKTNQMLQDAMNAEKTESSEGEQPAEESAE